MHQWVISYQWQLILRSTKKFHLALIGWSKPNVVRLTEVKKRKANKPDIQFSEHTLVKAVQRYNLPVNYAFD